MPITAAVGAFHLGIWYPTTDGTQQWLDIVGTGALANGLLGLAAAIVFLALGQITFRRLEKTFAQDL